jgi:hypothetical protein
VAGYIVRRVLAMFGMLVALSMVTFLMFSVIPADPARLSCGKACTEEIIAANNELPMEIAKMEFEKTFLRLSRDGKMTLASVQKAMDLAAASGVKDMAPAADVFMNMPINPTKP